LSQRSKCQGEIYSMYKPIPPNILKRILEKSKYALVAQDNANWIMESNGHVAVISQTMKLVPIDVIESILGPADIDETTFFKYLGEMEVPAPATAAPPQQSSEQIAKPESR
jgi:hypothetical protein